MKLFFVFLCLSLATLSLAAIPSVEEERSDLSPCNQVGTDGSASIAAGKSFQATKGPVKSGKKVLKKRSKKRVAVIKGAKKTAAGAGKKLSAVSGSGKSSQKGSAVLDFLPEVLVELIGEYLEGFSVVLERNWSAVYSWYSVAVDSERHYLITDQDVQASSHGDGKPVSLGSPDLSHYSDFHSSHDGRSVFFTGKTKEQVSHYSLGKTVRWLVQETGTKSLKTVTFESGGSSSAGNRFTLSANGKALVSTLFNSISDTWIASVYQIEEHEKAASASKKADIDGIAYAVSGNGNRILMESKKKKQLEIHDISGDESHLVLEINYAGASDVGPYALNNNGSKAAFIDEMRKLYIVDVDKEKGSISVDQLTPIVTPSSVLGSRLIYDAKDRLYVFRSGNLWLVDPSERELVSLEDAQVPQGYMIQNWAVSSSADYIVLLIRSNEENEEGKYQYQIVVKHKEDTKNALMRLCRYKS